MRSRTRVTRGALAIAFAMALATAQPASSQLAGVTDIVTSPGCTVTGGGRIVAANGDTATFALNASDRRPDFGRSMHIDHGPATRFRFTTVQVTSLTCIEDGRYAQLTGTGIVDYDDAPDQPVGFRLEVQDTREGRVADGYHLTLTNGYDTGLQPVLHGEIQVHFR